MNAYNVASPRPAAPPFSIKYNSDYKDGAVSSGERIQKLFDNNVLTKLLGKFSDGNNAPVIITYKFFQGPALANVYTITSANDFHSRDIKSWKLEASQDSVAWKQLDTRQDVIFNSYFETKIYDFPNTIPYNYYRLTIVGNNGDGLFQIAEWSMNFRKPE
jgi:hypothetical protein